MPANARFVVSLGFTLLLFTNSAFCANAGGLPIQSKVEHFKPKGETQGDSKGPDTTQFPVLRPQSPVERELKSGEPHSYIIKMAANQYLNAEIEQNGIDVVVAVYDPDGNKVFEVDGRSGPTGPEIVYLVTESSGNYRLEVATSNKQALTGRYEIKIVELKVAATPDLELFRAQQLNAQVEKLYGRGNFNEALPFAEQALGCVDIYRSHINALTKWRKAR